ncbi:lipoxygenase homology domain-containing protein 1-like [Canis aureus]
MSHDGTGPGNGWFLESIVVKSEEEDGNQEVLFPCNRWLDEYQNDGRTERELFAESSYMQERLNQWPPDGAHMGLSFLVLSEGY